MMINGREGGDHINDCSSSKLDQGGRRAGNTVAVAAGTSSASASSTTSSWSRLKDPRIVRVSRAFGGKDRHSKVCTVRGLRDRRVRLSVPTAIQLYDLQDRLGLNQPSKVVDWLLNAAKHEIDELPPLQMLPSSPNFITAHSYFHPNSRSGSGSGLVMKIGNSSTTGSSMINWDVDGSAIWRRNKAKEEDEEDQDESAATARETNVEQPAAAAAAEEEDDHEADDDDQEEEQGADHDNSNKRRQSHFDEEINVINNHGGTGGGYINVSPSNNFFSSRHNSSSTVQPVGAGLGLLNNISSHHDDDQQQYSSLIRWDPSTLSLAQAQSQSQPPAVDDFHNNINVVSLGSGLPHHQLLVYQPTGTIGHAAQYSASHFPYSHITAAAASSSTDYAPKQINFQMLMSSTNIPPNNNSLSNSLTPPNEGRPFDFTTNFLPTHKDCGK